MRSWVASLWLGIAAACGGSPDVVEAPVEAPVDWTGPQIIASDTAAGLAIECTAPTLGCAFELESATAVGDVTEVRCRYTTAGQAIVGQMLTPHVVTVAQADLGARPHVHVLVSTWEGGVQYVRAPDHVLALRHQRR
jgi:hypothetical protein